MAKRSAEHQHAKPGGGTKTHTHAFDPEEEHGHDDGLPLPKRAGQKALGMSSAGLAELTSAARGNLKASDFAWVDDDGEGHLPIHDASHVRNAAARFSQTSFPDAATKRKAASKVRAAAKRLGVELSDDSAVMKMAEGPALIAVAGQTVDLSERTVPYLTVGHWEFPDYGVVDIDSAKLRSVVQHFRDNVRGQDLPLCDLDHVDPVYRGLACGWVKDLVPDDPDAPTRIDAAVELNEVGDQLIEADRVRYTSPTLLRDWTDPATGITYPLVAAGVDVRTRPEDGASAMAFTNFPRLKQLGRVACAEDGTPRAAVLAMGELAAAPSPAKAARLLMQEPFDDGEPEDNDGPVPPCVYQPGQLATPSCPGFTRFPGDLDGDGTCLMATRECNGYRAVQSDEFQPPWQFSEGRSMPDDGAGSAPASQTEGQGQQAPAPPPAPPATTPPAPETQPPAPQAAPAAPATPPAQAPAAPQQTAADAAETSTIRAAEAQALTRRLEASEQRAAQAEARTAALENELRSMRMAERLGQVGDRLSMCLRTGRIDKATYDRLTEPTKLAQFAEGGAMDVVLETIEALPAGHVVPMGEVGSGTTPTEPGRRETAAQAITAKANEIMAAAAQQGRRLTYSEATKAAARELRDHAVTLSEVPR